MYKFKYVHNLTHISTINYFILLFNRLIKQFLIIYKLRYTKYEYISHSFKTIHFYYKIYCHIKHILEDNISI